MSNPDQDKPSFDEQWKRAFEDAELRPDNRVWAGLDAHLEGKARQRNRKWLWYTGVAASVLLCLISGISYWYGQEVGKTSHVAVQNREEKPSPAEQRNHPGANQSTKATASSEAHQPADSGSKQLSSAETASAFVEPATALARKPVHSSVAPPAGDGEPLTESAVKKPVVANRYGKNDASIPIGTSDKPDPAYSPGNQIDQTSARIAGRLPAEHVPNAVGKRKKAEASVALQNKNASDSPKRSIKANVGLVSAPNPKDGLPIAGRGNTGKNLNAVSPGRTEDKLTSLHPAEEATAWTWSFLSPRAIKNQFPRPLTLAEKRPIVYLPKALVASEPMMDLESRKHSSLWVNATFAPTYFNPNVSAVYQHPSSTSFKNNYLLSSTNFSSSQPQQDVSKPNFSYTAGLNVGIDLSGRWTLEGGGQYLYNSAQLQTQAYLENTTTSEKYPIIADFLAGNQGSSTFIEKAGYDYALDAYAPAVSTLAAPTRLNNGSSTIALRTQYQYMSIPVKLGYRLNRSERLRLMAFAGMSTDILLKNTLNSADVGVNTIEITPGGSSAYRSVNFSALLGLGLQYHCASHFSLIIEPTYRTALHSITKINSVQTLPSNLGLSMGIKYHF